MQKFVTGFLQLVNDFRKDPSTGKALLEKYKGYIDDKKVMRIPGSNCGIQLQQGKEAYDAAIAALEGKTAVPELEYSDALGDACKEYVGMLAQADDPNSVEKFTENVCGKHGDFVGSLSTLAEFGGETPEQTFVNLLAQDGSPNKNYINTLCDKKFKVIGLHFAEHTVYRYCTFIALAVGYKPK